MKKPLRECSVRTIRRRLAAQLGIPEARNVDHAGLYMYEYSSHVKVRVYKPIGGKYPCTIIFEENHPYAGFPCDELIAKLMLIA